MAEPATLELAWRRRKRLAAERALAELRHREGLRATIVAAIIAAPNEPQLDGRSVFDGNVRPAFVEAIIAAEILEPRHG